MVLYNAAARHAAVGADPPERYTGPLATKRWRRESDRLLAGVYCFRLAVRPLQPARSAVLVLWLARPFPGRGPVHPVRRGQPVDILGVLRPRLGGHRPPTFALANQVFGRRDTPVILSWIFAGHQVGGAVAAFGAGAVRSMTGDYLLAFVTSGLACLVASLLVLRVTRPDLVVAPAK